MFIKFLMLCALSLKFAIGAVEREDFNLYTSQELTKLESLEGGLRTSSCTETFSNVKTLLGLCQKNKVVQEIICKKFNCEQSLVSSFLSGKTPALKLVGTVHRYYEDGGNSILLAIKESEASTWHFSDALSWLPFGGKSTATSSTRSSDEGTPRNDSLSSQGSTPPKAVEEPDKKPLLEKHETIQGPNAQSGLRRRHLSADGDKQ